MNSILWLLIFSALLGGIGTIVVKRRNEKFQASGKAVEAEERTQAFAKQALDADETVILSDYCPSMKAHVLLTDKGLHYLQEKRSGDLRFDTPYAGIEKVKYTDFSANKVKHDGNVMNIQIKAQSGKCALYQFPKAGQIAQELASRGFM